MKKFIFFILIVTGIVYLLREEYQTKQYSDSYLDKTISVDVKDQVVYISGLGDFNQSDLETASKKITEVYGLKCEIIEPTPTYKELYTSDNKLNVNTCSQLLNHTNKTVYITNEYIFRDKIVCGSSISSGNFVIVSNNFNDLKNTTIHEMAHTFGLGHCDNQCILGHIELGDPNGKFCNDCKLKLGLK